jgi:hypothetical protein
MNRRGARSGFAKSTLAGLERSKIANPLWKKGRPESGTICASQIDRCSSAQRQERCRLEGEDTLRWGRVDRDAGRPEPAIEEQLDVETAERVADEDRRLVERAHDPVVVVDDLRDAEAGQWRRIGSDGLDRALFAGPGRGEASVPAGLEERDERIPAGRCHPAAMDEYDDLAQRTPTHGI